MKPQLLFTPITTLSPEQRLSAYQFALTSLLPMLDESQDARQQCYICYWLSVWATMQGNMFGLNPAAFIELTKRRPEDWEAWKPLWWPVGDVNSRLQCLESCIVEVRLIQCLDA